MQGFVAYLKRAFIGKEISRRGRLIYSAYNNNATTTCPLIKIEIQMIDFPYSECLLSDFESSFADFVTVIKLKG